MAILMCYVSIRSEWWKREWWRRREKGECESREVFNTERHE
jgi:hypothetical protein